MKKLNFKCDPFCFLDCPPDFGIFKRITLSTVPNQRSIRLSWTYDPDPEDTGFVFGVVGRTQDNKELNITVREHVIDDLGIYSKYFIIINITYYML